MLFELQKNEFENQAACFKETIVLLKKAFRDKFLSNSSIKMWHKEFKDSQKSAHDAPRCVMSSTTFCD